jgi:hypothetical protein
MKLRWNFKTFSKDRAIGLVLDFIHRLVCGRQKIPQRFGDWIISGYKNRDGSDYVGLQKTHPHRPIS